MISWISEMLKSSVFYISGLLGFGYGVLEKSINIQEVISTPFNDKSECYFTFCLNSNFISLYAVIFTIVIGLIFYIYGEKDGDKKDALVNEIGVSTIIFVSIAGLILSSLNIPGYYIFNLCILIYLFMSLIRSFIYMSKFNSSNISADDYTKKYQLKKVSEGIEEIRYNEKRNSILETEIQSKTNFTRILIMKDLRSKFNIFVSNKTGIIEDIDLNLLNEYNLSNSTSSKEESFDVKKSEIEKQYYLPYNIGIGSKVTKGQTLFGINNNFIENNKDFNINKFIKINANRLDPLRYLEKELRRSFSELSIEIRNNNDSVIKQELEKFREYIGVVQGKDKTSLSLLGSINDGFIYPLQEYAFKFGDFKTIKEIVSFSVIEIYKSFDEISEQKLDIFFNNLSISFWGSFILKDLTIKKNYQEMFSYWIYEIAEYHIKHGLKEDSENKNFYFESAYKLLKLLNNLIIGAYKKNDKDSFEKIKHIFESIFKNDYYDIEEQEKLYILKLKFIFGFVSCFIRENKNQEDYVNSFIYEFINSLPNDINKLIELCIETLDLSKDNSINWDNLSWYDDSKLGIRSGFITTDTDIVNFLSQVVYYKLKNKSLININVDISDERLVYNEYIKNISINEVFKDKGLDPEALNQTNKVFDNIKIDYDKKVKKNVGAQAINKEKIKTFFERNLEGYKYSSTINKNSIKNKIDTIPNKARGYNFFFYKERFIDNTNYYFSEDDDRKFGGDIGKSENNEILQAIYNLKGKGVEKVKLNSNKDYLNLIKDNYKKYDSCIIWNRNYIHLEDFKNPDSDLKSRQQLKNKNQNLSYKYKDTLNIYNVHPFQDQKYHKNSLFFFNKNDITITEFNPTKKEGAGVYSIIDNNYSIMLSVTNLAEVNRETRDKILEHNNDMKDEDLNSKVIFEIYKGAYLDKEKTDISNIKIYEII